MVDVIDEIAIRLVADGTDALDEADRLIDEFEEKGKDAGEAYAQSWSSAFQREFVAGGSVSKMAREHMETFKEAAEYIASMDLFPDFDAAELARFAEAFEMVGGEKAQAWAHSEKTAGMMARTNDLMSEFANIVTAMTPEVKALGEAVSGDAVPATEELSERFKELIAYSEQLGIVLDKKTYVALKKITDSMTALEEKGGDVSKRVEMIKTDMREQANNMLMVERQVLRVVDAYREMGIAIPNALQRERIRAHVKQLQKHADSFSDVRAEADRFTDSLIKQGKHLKASQGPLGKIGGFMSQMGINIGQVASGMFAFKILSDLIKNVVNTIKEAIDYSMKFTETSRDLSAAIRVNSVAGDENLTTYREWENVARQIAETTNVGLAASYETVSMALRELGAGTKLTDSEIEELLVTGAKFAKLYGEKLPGGIRKLSQFISTGYSQALQQLGLELGKVAQNQKAMEMGLGTNIDKLSESQQEVVRYSLIMDELNARTENVAISADTFADRLDKTATKTATLKKTLGDLFVPLKVAWEEIKVRVFEGFVGVVGIITVAIQSFFASGIAAMKAFGVTFDKFISVIGKKGAVEEIKALPDLFAEIYETERLEILRLQLQMATGDVEGLGVAAEGTTEAMGDMGDEIGVTAKQLENFIKEARKFDEGMAKITRRLNQAILDIEEQFRQRRAKSEVNLQRTLRDIDYDASVDRLEALHDFQIDEIRMREDHQKDIYQLEERFLLDLEDAVRNRDARQVLQLQRRFNLEKKGREEDFNLRTKRRKEDLAYELQDIALARKIRRQDRILAFNEEMGDLAAQESLRKEQVRLRAKRQEEELLEQIKNRLLMLTEAAEGELAIEKELLDALVEALNATYGEDGPWVQWHEYAVDVTQNAATGIANANEEIVSNLVQTQRAITKHLQNVYDAAVMARELANSFGSSMEGAGLFSPSPYYTEPSSVPTSRYSRMSSRRQRGGTVFATGPTDFIAGEGGRPERVDITPFSQSTGQPSAGFRTGGDKISIDLNVEASEMLKVEVADHTMGEIADVYVNITQRGFQGGRGA